MAEPKRPTEAEVAEFRRFAETDLAPMLLANPKLPLAQIMTQVVERWGMAAAKAGLISQEDVSQAPRLPTPEQIQRWEAEVGAFFETLRTEFPAAYRDPAFVAAVQERLPALVQKLMKPTS